MENPGKNTKKVSKNKDDKPLSDNDSSKDQVTRESKGQSKGVKSKKEHAKKGKTSFSTAEDLELDIPLIPESPKQKDKITINSPGLSADLVTQMKKLESEKNKVVLVNCERCKEIIAVPIPRVFILKSELPVVPISYVHKNSKKKDQHCITLHLDHDFDIRRQRISDVVISPK
ncbi:MAG: hypothetical protein KGD61_04355 [Candidatus Lokiarchaeota archaeon]|nr:hypothetical protein [Candidatus Lokiarchaeota archaeon]